MAEHPGKIVNRQRNAAKRQERAKKALELRKQGLTTAQIAETLGVAKKTVWLDIHLALEDGRREIAASGKELLQQRIDELLWLMKVLKPKVDQGNIAAQREYRKHIAEVCKLEGHYREKIKVEVEGELKTDSPSVAAAANVIRQLFGESARKPDGSSGEPPASGPDVESGGGQDDGGVPSGSAGG